MSGHSKFANIKHKKEKNDAAKGKVFTIIGREIAVEMCIRDSAGSWRNRRRRTFHGNQERFPFPAYSGKYGTEPGAEPDRSVFLQVAGEFQKVRSRHFHLYQLCAV